MRFRALGLRWRFAVCPREKKIAPRPTFAPAVFTDVCFRGIYVCAWRYVSYACEFLWTDLRRRAPQEKELRSRGPRRPLLLVRWRAAEKPKPHQRRNVNRGGGALGKCGRVSKVHQLSWGRGSRPRISAPRHHVKGALLRRHLPRFAPPIRRPVSSLFSWQLYNI